MPWPDIISGKIIYLYAKNILVTLKRKVLLSYDVTFLPVSTLFLLTLLLHHIF